jgi:hypothetical protein
MPVMGKPVALHSRGKIGHWDVADNVFSDLGSRGRYYA